MGHPDLSCRDVVLATRRPDLCELEGRVAAALDVGSGEAIADPFVATAALVELLGLRAAQVRR